MSQPPVQTDPLSHASPPAIPSANRLPLAEAAYGLATRRLDYLTDLHERHGDIYTLRLGLFDVVMLRKPEHIKRVLVDNVANYPKDGVFWRFGRSIGGAGVATSLGELWRRQRRTMRPHFRPREVRAMAPAMLRQIDAELDRWEEKISSEGLLDVAEASASISAKVATFTLFGSSLSSEKLDRLSGDLFAASEQVLVQSALHMLPRWLPLRPRSRFLARIERLKAEVLKIVEDKRANGEGGGDLMSALILAADEETGERMSEQHLRDQAITLFIASVDTTSTTLAWTYYFLSRDPAILARVEAEIAEVVGDREPSFDDLRRLDLLRRAIFEALRLRPPGWFIARESLEDDVIGGRLVPGGSQIFCSAHAVHHDPAIWEDPHRFDPDRFIPERSVGRHPLAWIPFGAGGRRCVGEELGMTEAMLAILRTLTRYRLGPSPGPRAPSQPAGFNRPKTLPIRLRRR